MEFRVPVEVLDHIFSFIKSDSGSLSACSSAHPMFAQIVERYFYHHIVIIPSTSYPSDHLSGYTLELSHIIKLLSDIPKIVDYVHILEFRRFHSIEDIAPIMFKFHAVQCIKLTFRPNPGMSSMPRHFKTALEDCLRSPALREVHIVDLRYRFPITILNDLPNITRLSLSGSFEPSTCCIDGPFPRLESFSLSRFTLCSRPGNFHWGNHIVRLRSFTCEYSNEEFLQKFLQKCSDTLENLDFSMGAYSLYETVHDHCHEHLVRMFHKPKLDLSSLRSLRLLTVRVDLCPTRHTYTISCLPAVVEICKTASSRLHLTVDIRSYHLSLSDNNFWPLVDLARLSAFIDRIHLYIRFGRENFSRADVVAALSEYQVLKESIERGTLFIHVHEAAPEFSFTIPSAGVLR